MAGYHIGTRSIDGRNIEIFVHLPVLAGENKAGEQLGGGAITYQDAQAWRLAQENPDGFTSVAPEIGVSENIDIVNGVLFEKRHNFRLSQIGLDGAALLAEIEAGNDNEPGVLSWINDISDPNSELYKELIVPLEWWGYNKALA